MVEKLALMISRYRSELMGIAILEVMLWHLQESVGLRIPLLEFATKLIYTPGFFFLSGFGLFYSLSANGNVVEFYKKRMKRLYLPYLIISSPFIIYIGILKGSSPIDILLEVSSISFWIKGNYLGVWYIAVTMLLYLITPLLYHVMFKAHKSSYVLAWVTIIVFSILSLYSSYFIPPYIRAWTARAYLFPLGMLVAAYSKEKRAFYVSDVILALLYISFSFFYARVYLYVGGAIVLFAIIMKYNEHSLLKQVNKILSWFGKYSLEIFLLHIMMAYCIKFTFQMNLFYAYIISDVLTICVCKYVSNRISIILKSI